MTQDRIEIEETEEDGSGSGSGSGDGLEDDYFVLESSGSEEEAEGLIIISLCTSLLMFGQVK